MLRPEAYVERPRTVELRQTHISWVFLADDFVYKVKKPVRFEFLDYSTLARRLFFCREEVRLNRRLAPEVYLGAVPILGRDDEVRVCSRREGEGDWPVAEYAVRMRRLPAAEMLDARLREGLVGRAEIDAVAARLAAFHETAALGRAEFGSATAVVNTVRSDFLEMMPHVGETLSKREAGDIERFYAAFADTNAELLRRRFEEGRIREGHGDLRAEHICLVDPIAIFDCVEFDERLRTVDVASEIAFLAMDLDFLGEPALAEDFVSAYAAAAHDDALPRLLPFYGCYRACVRGKVETLKSGEAEVPPRERVHARLRARRYFRLALRYARGAPAPALVLVCGPAGTGKSTVARLLAAETGFPIRSSDVVRKRLAGIPVTTRASGGYLERIYRPEFSRRTYERLLEESGQLLRSGRGAIVEATFLERVHRRPFVDLARALRLPLVMIECRADEAEVLRRLDERANDPEEASDAGRDVYLRHAQVFEPPTEVPQAARLVADTDRDLGSLPDQLRSLLGSIRQ